MSALHKDMKELQSEATEKGWEIERTQGGRVRWTLGQDVFFTPPSVHDHRAVQNIRAKLRRIEKARRA